MFRLAFSLLAAVLVLSPPAARAEGAVEARNGMVVAQEARAARIGLAVLERGGNAVDAAVATGFAMAVTYPRAGNIGGGGYMVIRLGERQRGPKVGPRNIAIDYRETAPAAATREMFLDEKGNADPRKSRDSALAIGVPGTVAGLALAHQRYGSGRLTLAELIAPAIALARDGFEVDDDIAELAAAGARAAGTLAGLGEDLPQVRRQCAGTRRPAGAARPRRYARGDRAARAARVLRGPDRREARRRGIQAAGGIMTADDLKNYRPHVRQPVRGRYRGHEIISMPPSSSGGVVLIEMLNVLEGYKLNEQDDAARLHLMIEAMRRAYADRAAYLGDPAVVSAPLARLMSKRYAAQLRANIDPARATPSREIRDDLLLPREGENTTHFSVIDRYGNAVANTYTLNFSYGVGLVAEGTGVLLNNELDDFAARPATPNAYGLIGGDANAPGPNKRPLSSMSPTIVTKNGRPLIVTGSPGGSRIITSVLQVVVNVIDRNMDVAAAVSAPRIHHQWSPDRVLVEQGLPNDVVTALEGRGHKIERRPYGGTSANTILVTPRGFVGAADPRTRGSLAAGY